MNAHPLISKQFINLCSTFRFDFILGEYSVRVLVWIIFSSKFVFPISFVSHIPRDFHAQICFPTLISLPIFFGIVENA